VLKLLVLQPTPFCNIACDYCYLPDRAQRGRMTLATLERPLAAVAASGLLGAELDVAWHAGEPLVVPPDYYRAAFELFRRHLPDSVRVRHGFQTNATLVDQRWCRFFIDESPDLGVSLDGPAWLHDAHRRKRSGAGTHAEVMRGVRLLQRHGIPFHAICVLTRESLDHADAVVDFFLEHGVERIGFNIEEADGSHGRTSLQGADAEAAYRRFMARVVERSCATAGRLRVREVESVLAALADPAFGSHHGNDQNVSFAILSIGWRGEVSTFSPEFLGLPHPAYGNLVFGSVATGGLEQIGEDPSFRRTAAAIANGVRACSERCAYFPVCLGGAPSNKLGELGDLSGTETVHCRLTQQALVDIVLDDLERHGPTRPAAPQRRRPETRDERSLLAD
jgi:uncharacterized protein